MKTISSYLDFVTRMAELPRAARDIRYRPETAVPAADAGAPLVLLFSPHPDDECITGALPLRLQRELRMRIVNVAVTQGSNAARQEARWRELQDACASLGFATVQTAPRGLESVTPKTRDGQPEAWAAKVGIIRELLSAHRPAVIFLPHADDWNGTHIGTHHLVMDALRRMPPEFAATLVFTEFWGAMKNPNLMVESARTDVADLIGALSLHTGEVARNPYHLRLPAWMQDNVRRGGELVGGQGGAAPDCDYATLYRVEHWCSGASRAPFPAGRVLPAGPAHPLPRGWAN